MLFLITILYSLVAAIYFVYTYLVAVSSDGLISGYFAMYTVFNAINGMRRKPPPVVIDAGINNFLTWCYSILYSMEISFWFKIKLSIYVSIGKLEVLGVVDHLIWLNHKIIHALMWKVSGFYALLGSNKLVFVFDVGLEFTPSTSKTTTTFYALRDVGKQSALSRIISFIHPFPKKTIRKAMTRR